MAGTPLRRSPLGRKGLGAKARRLPDHLLVKHLLAQRYGVEQFLADAEADASACDALEAAAPLALTGKAAEAAPPRPPGRLPNLHPRSRPRAMLQNLRP